MARLLSLLIGAALLLTPAAALAQTPAQPQTLQPSSNWSGYVAGNAYYSGVSALIQAPLPYAFQSLGVVASWVGIGGSTSPDLIQAGVEEVNSGPFVGYHAWYEMLPQASRNIVMDIQPGAWVHFDVHETAPDVWQISIVNGTNVFQRQVRYRSSHSSAEWVVEEPALYNGQLLPLAGVTGANFGNMLAIANGNVAKPSQLFPQTVGIVTHFGLVKAAPSGLGPDGSSFTVATV
jgi:peptidase A4-like protein